MRVTTNRPTMLQLREALEASWAADTAYLKVYDEGNPALGNCYPTSRVVQHFFPETEIVEGWVWTGESSEKHFWNLLMSNGHEYHIDLTWQQFPQGSLVKEYKIRDRETLGDGKETLRRIEILLHRVSSHLQN
jgi:hypothetical protein